MPKFAAVGGLAHLSLRDLSLCYRRRFCRALVVAFFVGAGDHRACLQRFFHQVLAAATGALFRHRFAGGGELALGIISASVKCVSFARFLFHQVALFAKRALHSDKILLHVFAVGIAAAGGELPVTPVADHHVAPAFGAEFVKRDVGALLALIEAPSRLAIGIAGAGHKLAEAAPLEDHDPAAVLAIFFLGGFLNIRRIQIGEVDRIFLGEGAAFGILFIVRTTGVEGSVLAPLDHQRRAAALALLVGRLLHPLDILHVLLAAAETLGESFVKSSQRV